MRAALLVLCAAFATGWPAFEAGATNEPRVALIVGNGSYLERPLPNPSNDAALIARTLAALDFEVTRVVDADRAALAAAIGRFEASLRAAGPQAVSFFFYAGHGVQVGGVNYLLPVDFTGETEGAVTRNAVSVDLVLDAMRRARSRVNFVVLDACRDNPFERRWRSAGGGGLATMNAPAGTLIGYSTAPGAVASDGDGDNSPYSAALARALEEADRPAELVFKRTRDLVIGATAGRQTPWDASSLSGADFYFRSGAVGAAGPDLSREAERAFWSAIENSRNPTDFAVFLEEHPDGVFAGLARARLAALTTPAVAAPAPAAIPQHQAASPPPAAVTRPVAGLVVRRAAARAIGSAPLQVVSVRAGSRFEGQVMPNDLIIGVNHAPVPAQGDPTAILEQALAARGRLDLNVSRGGASYFFAWGRR